MDGNPKVGEGVDKYEAQKKWGRTPEESFKTKKKRKYVKYCVLFLTIRIKV